MKSLPLFAFLAAAAAFLFAPISFEASSSILFVIGLAGVAGVDYGRRARPVSNTAAALYDYHHARRSNLRLAA